MCVSRDWIWLYVGIWGCFPSPRELRRVSKALQQHAGQPEGSVARWEIPNLGIKNIPRDPIKYPMNFICLPGPESSMSVSVKFRTFCPFPFAFIPLFCFNYSQQTGVENYASESIKEENRKEIAPHLNWDREVAVTLNKVIVFLYWTI